MLVLQLQFVLQLCHLLDYWSEVTDSVRVDMGDRIRDLEVLSNGSLLATTDSGKLITVSNS